jgi:hypothetical protein
MYIRKLHQEQLIADLKEEQALMMQLQNAYLKVTQHFATEKLKIVEKCQEMITAANQEQSLVVDPALPLKHAVEAEAQMFAALPA